VSNRTIPRRELFTVICALLVIIALAGGCLLAADCGSCLYKHPERYYSPDGEYVVTVRSTSLIYLTDHRNIKITAAGDGFLADRHPATEKYRLVDVWEVTWDDSDTARVILDGGRAEVVIDFAPDTPPVFCLEGDQSY